MKIIRTSAKTDASCDNEDVKLCVIRRKNYMRMGNVNYEHCMTCPKYDRLAKANDDEVAAANNFSEKGSFSNETEEEKAEKAEKAEEKPKKEKIRYDHTCKHCGIEFRNNKVESTFCSRECWAEDQRERNARKLDEKAAEREAKKTEREARKAEKAKGTTEEVCVCWTCRSVYPKPAKASEDYDSSRFCSAECAGNFVHKTVTIRFDDDDPDRLNLHIEEDKPKDSPQNRQIENFKNLWKRKLAEFEARKTVAKLDISRLDEEIDLVKAFIQQLTLLPQGAYLNENNH